MLKAKAENYLIEECRKNYANDILYIMANMVNQFITKENIKVKGWSIIYAEFKDNETKDTRTSSEIEKDILDKFKVYCKGEE